MRRTKHGWTWFVVGGLGLLVGCEKPAAPEGTAGGAGGADVKQSTDSAAPVDSQVGDSRGADIPPLTDGGPSVAPGDAGGDAGSGDIGGSDDLGAVPTDSADGEALDGVTNTDVGVLSDVIGDDTALAGDAESGDPDGAAADGAQQVDTAWSTDAQDGDGANVPPWCDPQHVIPAGTHPLSDFELPPLPPVPGFQGGFYECTEPPAQIEPAKVPGACLEVYWGPMESGSWAAKMCPNIPTSATHPVMTTKFGFGCDLRESIIQHDNSLDPEDILFQVTTKAWTDSGLPSHESKFSSDGILMKSTFWNYDELGRVTERLTLSHNSYKCCVVPLGAVDYAILEAYLYDGSESYPAKSNGYLQYFPVSLDGPWGEPWTVLYDYDEKDRVTAEYTFASSGKQVEHIRWSYIDMGDGVLVREEHDEDGWSVWSWDYPDSTTAYPLDGVTDWGREETYDQNGMLMRRRYFTGNTITEGSISSGEDVVPFEIMGEGGDIWEYRYDESGRLIEEWSWPDDWTMISENGDPIYKVMAWRYDEHGRPLMRIYTGWYFMDKSVISGIWSYHYDCWEPYAPPPSGAGP